MNSNTKLVRDHGQKHVTTACNSCRRKRCKCDGQKPCSQCRATTDPCIYESTDRRQRAVRRQRYAAQQRGSSLTRGESTEGYTSRSAIPGGQRPPSPLTEVFNVPSTLTMRLQNGATSISSNNNARHKKNQEPRLPKIEQMKSRFRVKSSMRTAMPEAGLAERRHVACRRLLPRDTHNAQSLVIGNDLHRMGLMRNDGWAMQLPDCQNYPVPGYTRKFGNLPFSSSVIANGYSSDLQARQISNFSAAPCLLLPLTELDDSPLGRALTDFQKLALDMTSGGTPLSEITGNGAADVTLFFRDRRAEDPINVSTWTSEMLRSFRGTFSDELLLACAVCVIHLLRWKLDPTAENYANMPSMIRPTTLQRLKPHPAWVDLMMFPSFRNALTNSQRDWVGPCMKAEWRLLWEKSLEMTVTRLPGSQEVFLCSEFATYVDDPQKWSMQRSILENFPEIQGTEINIL